MAFEGSVHHLARSGIQNIEPVFSNEMALSIGLGGEHDGTLRALEGFLT